MMCPGTYCLVISLDRKTLIQVGRLGRYLLAPGFYVYVGSALNGLDKRIGRHLCRQKRKHWHIDYLLECATIVAIRVVASATRMECLLNQELQQLCDGVPVPGFGSSDCRCSSHLCFFAENPLARMDRLPFSHTLIASQKPRHETTQ